VACSGHSGRDWKKSAGGNSVCRGFFDRHKTAPLQIAERLGFIGMDLMPFLTPLASARMVASLRNTAALSTPFLDPPPANCWRMVAIFSWMFQVPRLALAIL
jgi:hypothetical protein